MNNLSNVYAAQQKLADTIKRYNNGNLFSTIGSLLSQLASSTNQADQYGEYNSNYVSLQTFDASGNETTDNNRKLAAKYPLIAFSNRLSDIQRSMNDTAKVRISGISTYIQIALNGALVGYIKYPGLNAGRFVEAWSPDHDTGDGRVVGKIDIIPNATDGLYVKLYGSIAASAWYQIGEQTILLPVGADYNNTPWGIRLNVNGSVFTVARVNFNSDGTKYYLSESQSLGTSFRYAYWNYPDPDHDTPGTEYTSTSPYIPLRNPATSITLLSCADINDTLDAYTFWELSGKILLNTHSTDTDAFTIATAISNLRTAIANFS